MISIVGTRVSRF